MIAGRIRRKLAAALQRDIPTWRGKAITWDASQLHRHYGRPVALDRFCWSGSATLNETGNRVLFVDSWEPMSKCVRAQRLELHDFEIEPVFSSDSVGEKR